ncbi:sulfurtransferase TusA family protein [Thiomicrospira sp. R3]|uniref:sulfurtransferase TusA family protein n=1 Tax=Thiomicrospira sp. R3 TaxID=3035472 RepID=UPI00259B2D17|nr:sulfurtransferase TusA family protein [Thiomicrospira sp. R3]WFE68919.1 sulfurtransferase TusA family protein [Thiomicrospira sp. R3]
MNTHQLDAKGLKCPMPVINLQNLARQVSNGDRIDIVCTDPSAEKDIRSWCRINKHQFLTAQTLNSTWLISIKLK